MAKRTRRERRIDPEKALAPKAAATASPLAEAGLVTEEFIAAPVKMAQAPLPNNRQSINFGQEYFYVYRELATIVVITAIMFAVMIGLSFVI